jgi:hypothetical protein
MGLADAMEAAQAEQMIAFTAEEMVRCFLAGCRRD